VKELGYVVIHVLEKETAEPEMRNLPLVCDWTYSRRILQGICLQMVRLDFFPYLWNRHLPNSGKLGQLHYHWGSTYGRFVSCFGLLTRLNRKLSREKPIPGFKAMTRFRTYGWKQYRNVFYKLTFSIADGQCLAGMKSKNNTDLLISCDYGFADPKLLISQQNEYSITYNTSR